MMDPRASSDYQAAVEREKQLYEHYTDVHDLPAIFHYWSNRYVRPKLLPLGFGDAPEMFLKYLEAQCRLNRNPRFLSLGSGNCDLEIRLAAELHACGHTGFLLDCVELNPAMLDRGGVNARQAGLEPHVNLIAADLNAWTPGHEYDAVIAHHSLHHVVNLEGLFDGVRQSLRPAGSFLIADMIGRNGHQRWPEALEIVREFWRKLPPSYRFHRILERYEEMYENRDCSHEGFEGVRSQDILPLLLDRFHFHLFVGFGNVIDPFVDRAFGPNFDAASAWDRSFIDEVQRRDEQELDSGRITPTHMMAVVANQPCDPIAGHPSPRFCVRVPEPVPDESPVEDAYDWEAWPHRAETELRIACGRLAESESQLRRTTAWALALEKEHRERTGWALDLEKQLEQRTKWAADLQKEIAEHAALAARLRSELEEKSAWALNLETGRLRLETLLGKHRDSIGALEQELLDRSRWALGLQAETEEQKRRLADLQSYMDHPSRYFKRLASRIWRRR